MSMEPQGRPTGSLVADALTHLSNLVRGEVALAKAELLENLRNAATGIVMLIAAAILAITALNVLAGALVAGISSFGVPPAYSALIVGVLLALIGWLLFSRGKAALQPANLVPGRTAKNVRRDAESIKESFEK